MFSNQIDRDSFGPVEISAHPLHQHGASCTTCSRREEVTCHDAPVPRAGRLNSAQDEVLGRGVLELSVPARTALPEHKPGIVFHARFLQQRHKLLFETPFAMMLALAGNVMDHCLALRLADAERSIPFLPCEPVPMLV